ncbi:MAG: dihydrolipoyl dehydrogenase [Candidatus Heimdallarchaeota archaeon]|nr:dihydrolipoyl dehydrogenase [Candidatus Heimdallarchaeota archaeon]
MKTYDLIAIGSGTPFNILTRLVREGLELKVAMIDKDPIGGICLTRGCIPSKILLYPAELVREQEKWHRFGISGKIDHIDFKKIMERTRSFITPKVERKRQFFSEQKQMDYYTGIAEFSAPYTLKVGEETIKAEKILLCLGSEPTIPPIQGLNNIPYQTNKTIFNLKELPESICFVGGGYIAAELGHFFAAIGSEVTIIGRNPQFIPGEEPEVSALAEKELSKHLTIHTGYEVRTIKEPLRGKKKLVAVKTDGQKQIEIVTEEVFIAAGRRSNSNLLHPEKSGIKTDKYGWIIVNEQLETTQSNIWAFGDCTGRYLFKHVALYEMEIVYQNAIYDKKVKVDYRAVPHAVFTYPEIGSVGLKQKEAVERYGEENIFIGFHKYQDVVKGQAMGVEDKDYFVKVLLEKNTRKVLGAHIIGPEASVLIQEVINLMYAPSQNADLILNAMYIHPALPEVVQRALRFTKTIEDYQEMFVAR